jgi:flagellar hook-basal body complex protein FliE
MATNAFAAGAYAATQGLAGFGQGLQKPASGKSGLDFGSVLQGALETVAQAGHKAESQAIAAASGKSDMVDVVTAVAESEAALETLVAVRDRVISAYEDIMRMPI